jgi:two-component system response regulator BaeR
MKLIAIVEDEPKIATLLADYLAKENFATRHHAEGTGVVEAVRREPPDLMILDIMLPGKDGLTIAKEVRAFSDLPIILLTARVEEIDRLLGLELGADDYICKPFSPREVVARVKAILKRVERKTGAAPQQPDPIRLDEARFSAEVLGKPVTLTPVEFRLLSTLAARPGQVFSRNQLMDALYLDHRVVSDRTVDSHVKNLRKKIVEAGGGEEWLRSIYGVGYKIEW